MSGPVRTGLTRALGILLAVLALVCWRRRRSRTKRTGGDRSGPSGSGVEVAGIPVPVAVGPVSPPQPSVPVRPGRRPRPSRMAMVSAIVTGVLCGSGLAWGAFSAKPSAETNSFTAGSLSTPASLTTLHPNVTGSGDGNVTLTWTDSLTRAVTFLVQRAPASTPTSWATINGAGSGQSNSTLCTGSVPGTVSCTYLDNSTNSTSAPAYNSSYVYQVVATLGGWSAPSAGDLAASLNPTSGTETYLAPPSLNAISSASTTSIWAVGASCTVDYYNGTSWTPQTVPTSVCPSGTSLNGVDANSGTPMVVGGGGLTFLCTANCTTSTPTWSAKSSGTTNSLNAVSAKSTTSIWAVGASCTVLYYNGTSWASQSPSTSVCASGTTLNGLSNFNGNPVVAGNSATLFTCTANCTATPTWTTNTITGISGSPNLLGVSYSGGNGVWAVGAAGTVATCTANCNGTTATWHTQTSGTTNNLNAVMAQGSNAVFAAGNSGTVLECTANCSVATGTWTTQSVATTANLEGINAPASTSAWAVGAAGTIVTTAVSEWGTQSSGLAATVYTPYTLVAGDLTNLSTPDSSLYTGQAAWPSTAMSSVCGGSNVGLVLLTSPTVPTGSWSVASVQATVVYQANAAPGTGSGFQLLASANSGSTWTAYSLTAPTSGGTPVTSTVSILATISTTAKLSTMELCFQGTSGTGPSLKTSIDLVHVDVN